MSDNLKLGQLITGQAERDACHVAVFPAIAAEDGMRPGEPVKLVYGTTDLVRSAIYGGAIGVIDPFLRFRPEPETRHFGPGGYENEVPDRVRKDDRFYVFLRPGLTTGLRHHYFCAALDSVRRPENEHEDWLRQFCERWQFDYDDLVAAGTGAGRDPDWRFVTAHGVDLHSRGDLGEGEEAAFWEHLEAITGSKYDEQHREKMGWSCSC